MMKGWIFAMLGSFGFSAASVLISLDYGASLEQLNAAACAALFLSLVLGVVGVFSLMNHYD